MKNFREIKFKSANFHLEEIIYEENMKFSRKKCQEIDQRKRFVKSIACVLTFHQQIPETGPKISSNQNLDV